MDDVIFTLSIINITMFAFAIIGCVDTFRYINLAHKAPLLKNLLSTFLITTLLMSGWFIKIQIVWLIEDHNTAVGDFSAWSWLVYDYAKAFHTLASVAAVYVYLRWNRKGAETHTTYQNRRSDP